MTAHECRVRPGDDRGSVSVVVAVVVPCLLVVLALVVDGADKLRATAHAHAVAQEAARAALSAVDTRGSSVTLEADRAATLAQAYLRGSGHTGTVDLDSAGRVRVVVEHSSPAAIGLLGDTHHVTGQATASLGVGTSHPGSLP